MPWVRVSLPATQALLATRDNANKNGVGDQIRVGQPATVPAIEVDILLANILSDPLIDLASRLVTRCRIGAQLVLSGILEHQADAVARAYGPFAELRVGARRNGWIRLEGTVASTRAHRAVQDP